MFRIINCLQGYLEEAKLQSCRLFLKIFQKILQILKKVLKTFPTISQKILKNCQVYRGK